MTTRPDATAAERLDAAMPWLTACVVALVGLAFAGLLGRAAYVQIVDAEFFQKQGEKRYAHVLDVPASRGRGAFELSLRYIFTKFHPPQLQYRICPDFI